ncbi:hypothetical protein [Petrocella sp. FN5]|uniref:hypothetical protein n=1 Tax=Petrocella sp. FN5 TaxID=3032002 RepID=UPI002ED054CE
MTRIYKKISPSMDEWLNEAKSDRIASQEGMYLIHNGVVRQTPKMKVRNSIRCLVYYLFINVLW